MNNKVKKIVFYSTRQIHPYFSDKEHLLKCNSMIYYFSKLQNSKGMMDEFAAWLSDLAFLANYQKRMEEGMEENGGDDVQSKLDELRNLIKFSSECDPHKIRVRELALLLNRHNQKGQEQDLFWKKAYDEYIKINKASNFFETNHFELFRDQILSGKTTHLNRDLTESRNPKGEAGNEGTRSSLKHRLGTYCKDDGGYAVMAIWPWAGEMETDHNKHWKNAIVKTIREFYPQCDEIILAIHDNDFANLKDNEKDAILFVGRKVSKMNDQNDESDSAPDVVDPRISLIVFQHTNKNVLKPIQEKNSEGGLYSTKEVWEEISRYLKRDSLRETDNNNSVAKTHNSTDNV